MKGWLHPAIPCCVVYKQGMFQSSTQGCLLRQDIREDMNLERNDVIHYHKIQVQNGFKKTQV